MAAARRRCRTSSPSASATAGLVVEHVREGGLFASSVTQALRELGRDSRNLALTPRAELMLYLTREVQLLDEATRPALERADIVIADRFVATAEVLAVYGRGLPAAEVSRRGRRGRSRASRPI